MKASAYGIKNLQRIVVKLPEWTKEANKDYASLNQMYTALVSQYNRYMGHVSKNIGGIQTTPRMQEEAGIVVEYTSRAKQIAQWNYNGHRKTLALSLLEISTTDLRNDIARIKQPVLILGSIYQTKENSFKILEEQYKNVQSKTIRVADSKHFIMYDAPVWMYNEIDNFLK